MQTRRKLWISGVTLVVLSVVGVGVYAQQKRTPKLSAEDWIEIRTLYSLVPISVDNLDDNAEAEALANLWVEDGTIDSSPTGQPQRGRKAIAEALVNSHKSGYQGPGSPRRHYVSNVLIEASPEGAMGTAYFAMMKAGAKEGEPSVVEMNGIYNDVFVKTRDGWKFKSRKFRRVAGGAPASSPAAR